MGLVFLNEFTEKERRIRLIYFHRGILQNKLTVSVSLKEFRVNEKRDFIRLTENITHSVLY
jgi:hypothetical protein